VQASGNKKAFASENIVAHLPQFLKGLASVHLFLQPLHERF